MTPKSRIGECLRFWIKDGGEGHFILPMEAYFDGSYHGKTWTEERVLTLAGFAAEDDMWGDVENAWREILADDRKRPKAAYLHMKEAVSLHGEFDQRKGWTVKKVFELAIELLMYLQHVDKERFRQFCCTIKLEDYAKLVSEGWDLDDPIIMCNNLGPYYALWWHISNRTARNLRLESIHYFFDKDEPFEDVFKSKWREECKKPSEPIDVRHNSWKFISTVASAVMRTQPALQAADLLAWSANRSFMPAEKIAVGRNLVKMMTSVIPSSWTIWDEKKFRDDYETKYKRCFR